MDPTGSEGEVSGRAEAQARRLVRCPACTEVVVAARDCSVCGSRMVRRSVTLPALGIVLLFVLSSYYVVLVRNPRAVEPDGGAAEAVIEKVDEPEYLVGPEVFLDRTLRPVVPALTPAPTPAPTPAVKRPERPLEELLAAVVLVEGVGVDVGSGFLIGNDRVLTMRPLVDGASSIVVTGSDGRQGRAEAEPHAERREKHRGLDREHEQEQVADLLVVLRLAEPWKDVKPLSLRTTLELRPGAQLSALGYPVGAARPAVTRGIVSASLVALPGIPIGLIQMDASVNPGQGGGPVVDRSGDVVGIIAGRLAGLDGMNYALAADYGLAQELPVADSYAWVTFAQKVITMVYPPEWERTRHER